MKLGTRNWHAAIVLCHTPFLASPPHGWRVNLAVIVAVALAGCAGPQVKLTAGPAALEAQLDGHGLSSLKYRGVELLADGRLQPPPVYMPYNMAAARLRKPDGSIVYADMKAASSLDAERRTLTLTYPWGVVRCAYDVLGDRLRFTVEVANTSETDTVQAVYLQLVSLRFPRTPAGWDRHTPRLFHNLGGPTIIGPADYGDGAMVFCNEDVVRPLISGFLWSGDGEANRTRQVIIASSGINWLGSLLDPYVVRPIPPGGSDRYVVSLRFGPSGAKAAELAADLEKRFAEAFPYQLKWEDRRPIGALFLSLSNSGWPTNPRGYLNDKTIDVTSAEGRAEFRKRLLAWADGSVRILKDMNAQGMILWDVEGQEYPHATSYLGDPRSLPPEMDEVADELFKRFTDAGLRVGVCVRPQLPVRAAYAPGVWQMEVADPLSNMSAKIAHAKKRWGCTLFYVDSNGDPNVPTPAELFRRLAEAHPDVLLMPEHENTQYFAYTAPYRSLQHDGLGPPEGVLRIYPQAFCPIYVPDGPVDKVWNELVAGVARGNILVFRGWYGDEYNAKVKRVYEEAAKRR